MSASLIDLPLSVTVLVIIVLGVVAVIAQVQREKINVEIDKLRRQKETMDGWLAEAKELGEEAAANAASWVIDGRYDRWHYEALLRKVQEGEHEPWELPSYPNLSGEWAGDPTPQSLACDVVGAELDGITDEADVIDALANAWEEGVDEMFMLAIEMELMEALGEKTNA